MTRADANEFAEGVKTTTVGRQISILRAIFNVADVLPIKRAIWNLVKFVFDPPRTGKLNPINS